MSQNVLIQIMYWRIARIKIQRGCVMHGLHVIDFNLKIKWRNVIQKLLKKMDSEWNIARQCISDKYIHICSAHCPLNCTFSFHWICKTCQRKIMRSQIPAEYTSNNMQLFDVPVELENLNTLENYLQSVQAYLLQHTSQLSIALKYHTIAYILIESHSSKHSIAQLTTVFITSI